MTKRNSGRKVVASFYNFQVTFNHEGRQSRNSGRSHGGMLLTGLLPQACSTCFLRNHRPRDGTAHNGVGPALPCQPLIKKKPYTGLPLLCSFFFSKYGTLHESVCQPCAGPMLIFSVILWSYRGIFLIEVPSSQMTLVCVKLIYYPVQCQCPWKYNYSSIIQKPTIITHIQVSIT